MVTETKQRTWQRRVRDWLPLAAFELAICGAILLCAYGAYQVVSIERNRAQSVREMADNLKDLSNQHRADYQEMGLYLDKLAAELSVDGDRFVIDGSYPMARKLQQAASTTHDWLDKKLQPRQFAAGKMVGTRDSTLVEADVGSMLQRIAPVPRRLSELASDIEGLNPVTATAVDRFDLFKNLNRHLNHLRALAVEARMQADVFSRFQPSMQPLPPWPREAIVRAVGLVLIILLCGWLAVEVYRRQITTLRQELSVSKSQMDRQEKLARKGRVAAELAHELRNPLTAINLRLQMLSESLDVDSEEERDVRLVRKEVRRLNLILEDFLRLDRAAQLVLASVSSSVLLRDVDDLMQPVAARTGIRFKVEEEKASMVQVDPGQIKQVLLNLAKNACESVDHDGEVVLRSFSSTATVSNKVKPVWVVEVEDNGPGITPDVQAKLFEPFFTTKQNGTGLGLAIAERIVQQHKGAIDFETDPGKGTRFRIMLPLKEQA